MRLFVTGAGGFLGTHVAELASARGHEVRALVRTDGAERAVRRACPDAEIVRGDLMQAGPWVERLRSADAVIHLAATMAGGLYAQFSGTVVATEKLLQTMTEAGCRRLVHISTFSVYDYANAPSGSVIDEHSALATDLETADAYAVTKLLQERLVRAAADGGLAVTILRPGAVWGAEHFWAGGLGQVVGPVWFDCGSGVARKFTYVENCAEAIVLAAETDAAIGETVNVVDDRIGRRQFERAIRRRSVEVPRALPVPYVLWHGVVALLGFVNRRFLDGRAKLPSMFTLGAVEARFKPLTYPNDHAREVLGWRPRYGLEEAVDRAVARARPADPGP